MTKQEAFQFLDLPEHTDAKALAARYKEKYNFFKMLHTNAPNGTIRQLQQHNLDNLDKIKILLGISLDEQTPEPEPKILSKNAASDQKEEATAWLVVHTENKQTQSYPLYEGENLIGRNEVQGKHNILLDDVYVSRYHCVFIIAPSMGKMAAAVADDGRYNNKPSKNGTFVNGSDERIKMQRLQEGDTIQIGYCKLMFKWNRKSINAIEEEVQKTDFIKTVVIDL